MINGKREKDEMLVTNLKSNQNNDLYYVVFYLAPGDYHRFHSPSRFLLEKITHIPGLLRKVS